MSCNSSTCTCDPFDANRCAGSDIDLRAMARDYSDQIDCVRCGKVCDREYYPEHLDECDVEAEEIASEADRDVEEDLEDTADDYDDSYDGDHGTALESVYGPDNCAEDW